MSITRSQCTRSDCSAPFVQLNVWNVNRAITTPLPVTVQSQLVGFIGSSESSRNSPVNECTSNLIWLVSSPRGATEKGVPCRASAVSSRPPALTCDTH